MKNQLSLLRWTGLCALVLAVFAGFAHTAESAAEAVKSKVTERVDLIIIDTMAAEGALELPPVVFMHDQHTLALAKENKDCSSCHKPVESGLEGQISFSYLDTASLKGDALKNAYHENCIGCHAAFAAEGKATGPLESSCRSCHNSNPQVASVQVKTEFYKLQHEAHLDYAGAAAPAGSDKSCGACHHTNYDAATRAFAVKDGTEDACSSCHMTDVAKKAALAKNPAATDRSGKIADRTDIKVASHTSCISCHINMNVEKGMSCGDCHNQSQAAAVQSADKKNISATRLERDQPDAVLMTPPAKEGAASLAPVAFNHKAHEGFVGDCKSCHHTQIDSCSSCHSATGKEAGNFVTLYTSMHKPDSTRSCIGCHNQELEKPSCAGCHASMPKDLNQNSCAKCHTMPTGVSESEMQRGAFARMGKDEQAELASSMIRAREAQGAGVFAQTEIPDLVTIGILSDVYEPTIMPHRKIVKALADKESQSPLAKAFHTGQETLCQGCHHNSPASPTPPKCVSCHAAGPQPVAASGVPALQAAYHLQCMSCHTRMDQKPAATDCNACHKPRVK